MTEPLGAACCFWVIGLAISIREGVMRVLNIAVVAATLLVPSVGYSQDSGRVGGLIGPNLQSTAPARPAGPQSELPATTGAHPTVQSFQGYPANPGGQVPADTVTTPAEGGMVSGIVNGHSVIIDPTTHVIMRVLN
jgi:hypothetical protein